MRTGEGNLNWATSTETVNTSQRRLQRAICIRAIGSHGHQLTMIEPRSRPPAYKFVPVCEAGRGRRLRSRSAALAAAISAAV